MWQVTLLRSLGLPTLADSVLRASVTISNLREDYQHSTWLHWWVFRVLFFLSTLGNAVMLAFELEHYSGGLFSFLPHLFAGVLALEVVLSVSTYGLWVLVVHYWLLWNLVTVHIALWGTSMFFLRILGVLRLVEYALTPNVAGTLRKLALGVIGGFSTLMWSLVVIGVSVFFFGTIAESVLSQQDTEIKNIYFGDLSKSMFSLFQLLTLSGWSQSIVRKFYENGQIWFTALMIFYILFSVLIVLNLLTAVIIEGAFSDLAYEEEQDAIGSQNKQAKIIEEVQIMLNEAVPPTSEHPDFISKSEYERVKNIRKFAHHIDKLNISSEELDDIYNLFDEHQHGHVNIEELCAGFVKLKANINAKDIFSCVAHLKALTGSLEKISDAQGYRALLLPLERLEQEILPQFSDDIDEVLRNIDQTLVAIQQESMGRLSESIRATLPPKPQTPPKPKAAEKPPQTEAQRVKLTQRSMKSSESMAQSSGFLGSDSAESGGVPKKRLRFADN